MFRKKVGSDPCLVLDCVATLATTTVTFTITQKFNFEDIVKATETKAIKLRVTTTNASLITIMGNVHHSDVVALDTTNKRIYFRGVGLSSGDNILTYATKNADTGVWSGTLSIA